MNSTITQLPDLPIEERIAHAVEDGLARVIPSKGILSPLRAALSSPDVFGLGYNMNLYRGCQHGCIYCDSRSLCYQLGDISDIRIKADAPGILRHELSSKRRKRTIGTGSMNDPYMPLEARIGLTREALGIIRDFRFPIHVITKSDLVVRDIDLLSEIGKVYSAVSITITTPHDELSRKLEPRAPLSSARFAALGQLAQAGIYTGVFLMPILPFITDRPDDLLTILRRAAEAGAKYVIPCALTQREGQREYFHEQLDSLFPGLRAMYVERFGGEYECPAPGMNGLYRMICNECEHLGMTVKMRHYKEYEEQLDWSASL